MPYPAHIRRKTARWLHSRLFVIAVLIALQILLIFVLNDLMSGMNFLLRLLSFALVLWILAQRDNASYKISWILLILLFPLPGSLFYLIFGNKRMGKGMKQQLDSFGGFGKTSGEDIETAALSDGEKRQARCLLNCAEAKLYGGTHSEYFSGGELLFHRLLQELEKAEHFILLEYFIIDEGALWNSVFETLEKKAQEGVEIRILGDDAGCITTLPTDFGEKLKAKGIDFLLFNPLQPRLNTFLNYRDHRKIAVIDGKTAFIGGANLADEYVNLQERHGHWKDTGLLLQGSAVEKLTELFLQLWQFSSGKEEDFSRFSCTECHETDGLVQPFGSDPVHAVQAAKIACLQLCAHSTESLYLTTPYLVLDDESLCALQTAALSGVDVRIITPRIGDKWYVQAVTRSFYLPLLEAGVRIFEYTPGFFHGKMMISDRKQAIIGSINLDFRSFYLQFECGALLYHCSAIQDMTADFLAAEEISQEITAKTIKNTPLLLRFLRSILRIISPLL